MFGAKLPACVTAFAFVFTGAAAFGLGSTETPTDDAYVTAGSVSGANYGAESRLIVRNFPIVPNFTRVAYVRFDLGELVGSLDSAVVELTVLSGSVASAATPLEVYRVENDGWSEDLLTWDTQPEDGAGQRVQSFPSVPSDSVIAVDVLSLIASERATDGTLTLRLAFGGLGTSPELILGSKENTTAQNHPRLVWEATNDATEAPQTPGGWAATVASDMEVHLQWDGQPTDVDWYRLERRTESGSWEFLKSVPGTLTSYRDQTVEPRTAYGYRIRAANGAGVSAWSGEVGADTGSTTPPETPSDLRLARLAPTAIELEWTDNSTIEEGYVIQWRNDCGAFETVAVTAADQDVYVDTGLQPGRSHTYRVVATNGAGDSPPSPERSITLDVLSGLTNTFDFDFGDLGDLGMEGCCREIVPAGVAPVRSGAFSYKATLTKAERRSEVAYYDVRPQDEVTWYGWSIFIPAEMVIGEGTAGRFDIISQWPFNQAADPCPEPGTPTGMLFNRAGRWSIGIRRDGPGGICDPDSIYFTFDSALDEKERWVDFVMQANWSSDPAMGFVKLWKDDVLVVDYAGATFPAGLPEGAYWKAGIYKGAENWPGNSPRVLYFDEMRMGGPGSSYEEVNPDTYRTAPTFADWQTDEFGPLAGDPTIAGPLMNPDQDTQLNVAEYGNARRGLTPDGDDMMLRSCGSEHLVIVLPRAGFRQDLIQAVEYSTNGATWSSVPSEDLLILQDTEFSWEARVALPTSGEERRFWRVVYSLSE